MVSRALARRMVAVVLVLNLLAVTWPGLTFANRVEPMLFGLPFVMAWVAGWIVLSCLVLALLEWGTDPAELAPGERLDALGTPPPPPPHDLNG